LLKNYLLLKYSICTSPKNILKTILLLTLLIFLSASGIAHAQHQTSACIDLNIEMTSLCKFTPEQATKILTIIADFEKKRDSIYTIYHYSQIALTYEAKENRRKYESNLIGILTPTQMGLIKAFDSKNPGIMTHNCHQVIKVDYLAEPK
jgi:hypothetical protein